MAQRYSWYKFTCIKLYVFMCIYTLKDAWKYDQNINILLHAAKSLQSCPTLCDPIDCSPPGSAVPGILQARTLEWGTIFFSNGWKWKVKVKWLSHVRLFETAWTAAYQAPPSMGFSRQEYWSGVPLPSLIIVHLYFHACSNCLNFLQWMFVIYLIR